MHLRTHERIWLVQIIDHTRDIVNAPKMRGDVDELRAKLAPTPESILRDTLESIVMMREPLLENARGVARAGLDLARKVENAND